MRNIPIAEVDHMDRAVLAIGTDYPPGCVLPPHTHRRAQVLFAVHGVMRVDTSEGSWTIPTERAVLIPAGTAHRVEMPGVSTRSLYIEPARVPWFPTRCTAVDVPPLLRELILAATDLDPHHAETGRDAALIDLLLHEIRLLAPLPLELPLPADPALRALCERFLGDPDVHTPPSVWAAALALSERSFSRLFRAQTGMSFSEWRRRACILAALEPLQAGEAVGRIAARLGYENPAAFTVAFRTLLGSAPSTYSAAV